MKDERDMERMLDQVTAPALREGPHREQLKIELLDTTKRSLRTGVSPMKANDRFRTTRLMKLVAGVLIAAMLVATGWTAEKVYRKVKKSYYLELEKFELPPMEGSEGSGFFVSGMVGTMIPDNAPPGSAEKLKKQHEMMRELIAKKKYKFIEARDSLVSGQTEYSYQFTFPDGEQTAMNFSMRLENVTSWDDYLQKTKEQIRQRNEKISRAVAAGKFRLLDVEPLTTHVCQDVESNQKLLILRIERPDGKEVARVRGETADARQYQTSWQDHLQSIRQGERVLSDLQITKKHTYEITLDDGSTTIFTYGGEPLKKPQS